MKVAVRAACVIVSFLAATGWTAAETPEELFELGNAAYEDNRFAEAIEAYQTVARYGIRDPRLEYNLGNAYFRMGDLGRAILHYERARMLSPTDRDVRANLELARSRRFDRVEAEQVTALVGAARSFQDRIGPDLQAVAVLVLVWVIATLVTWMSVRARGWSGFSGWGLVAVVLAVLLMITTDLTVKILFLT